jgi:glutamate-1-semialdehyde 2,1-aminomutase
MKKLNDLMPGGASPYSKSMDVFPGNAPEHLVKGKGCKVWDNTGKELIDWGMGVRSVIIGHAYKSVDDAVIKAIRNGVNMARPTMYEYELAELLCEIIPCCEMVKFGKSGSDATSAAVKLARAYTGRDIVLVAAENPCVSQHDWFIGTTPVDGGIPFCPKCMDNTSKYLYSSITNEDITIFPGNSQVPIRLKGLIEIIGKPAAIILDPATVDITKEKLQYIRDICNKYGIVMILDEIISGFRYGLKGVQGLYGITPDLATFGKAMANGYSISALAGKREIMQLGDRDKGNVFLLSGTYFGCTDGIAAAIATIMELQTKPVNRHIDEIGHELMQNIHILIQHYGLGDYISVNQTYPCNPSMKFKDITLKTYFDQIMVVHGILMPYIAPSYSHSNADIETTLAAADDALKCCKRILESGEQIWTHLAHGHVEKPVFRRCEKS